MGACPDCGRSTPIGGRRAIRYGHSLLETAKGVAIALDRDGPEDSEDFVHQGEMLARQIHAFGHMETAKVPDWEGAGLWMKRARRLL